MWSLLYDLNFWVQVTVNVHPIWDCYINSIIHHVHAMVHGEHRTNTCPTPAQHLQVLFLLVLPLLLLLGSLLFFFLVIYLSVVVVIVICFVSHTHNIIQPQQSRSNLSLSPSPPSSKSNYAVESLAKKFWVSQLSSFLDYPVQLQSFWCWWAEIPLIL